MTICGFGKYSADKKQKIANLRKSYTRTPESCYLQQQLALETEFCI